MKISLTEDCLWIINTLERGGFEAYVVGGAVRDSLLGLAIHDYDLTTSAKPWEMKELFTAYPLIEQGEKHGTIGLIMPSGVYEVTSFRQDGAYLNHRHPDEVSFSLNLEEDVKRRDFTVNALAYHPKIGLIDYVGGLEDIKNKCLRTVGDPNLRFSEDALRIMRCFRFASTYGLTIHEATYEAAIQHLYDLDYVAKERITEEFKRLLEGTYLAEVFSHARPLFDYVLPSANLNTDMVHFIAEIPAQFILRLSYLLNGSSNFTQSLAKLVLSKHEVQELENMHQSLEFNISADARAILEFANRQKIHIQDYLILKLAIEPKEQEHWDEVARTWEKIEADSLPLSIQDLKITGHDVLEAGYTEGKIIQDILYFVWQDVIDGSIQNTRQEQLAKILEFKRKS